MPELPDIDAYCLALSTRVLGQPVRALRFANPFVLRSVAPRPDTLIGQPVRNVRRLGKRIALGFDGDLWLVLHLMIAGRLQWKPPGQKIPAKLGLLAVDFDRGTLLMTEAGSKRRASVHIVSDEAALAAHDPGGVEPLQVPTDAFIAALQTENHTLKRALTNPKQIAGIGNAYSDEILHRARLSPLLTTAKLSAEAGARLHHATVAVLGEWRDRLCAEATAAWPEKVTAFRPEMAVHGKFGQPCPDCGSPVQRIVYAENECNYCARCQTDGRLLADRALSKLLHDLWPRTLAE